MRLTLSEKREFYKIIEDYIASDYVQEMKQYIQHGKCTTFHHCISVAYFSYWLCLRLSIPCDIKSVTRGAFLHDFYLYDWHIPDDSHRLHGFYHPGKALKNANKYFFLNPIEQDIIEKHMWPLTITKLPKYRESVIVCLVDKVCSLIETINF